MEELFANIPEHVRKQAQFWVDISFHQPFVPDGIKMIESYRASCSDEEKEYLDFVVMSYLEQLR